MEVHPTLEQIAATMRRVLAEHHKPMPRSLSDTWANEAEVLQLCGKKRQTLMKAISSGKISPKDIRPNPIGKGYLFRRSALIKD